MVSEARQADCLLAMGMLEPNSFDGFASDPPYGIGFMGKTWDHGVPGVPFWQAALRVVKPGGYLVAFGGTRTFHRLMVAIEDAGWEIRDTLMWMYGSGFPKSLDVGKALDKRRSRSALPTLGAATEYQTWDVTEAHGDEAKRWQGWGTALKPAWEPIILARKPHPGTIAANVLKRGVGALNIDGCRIGLADSERAPRGSGNDLGYHGNGSGTGGNETPAKGRWPANVILDEDAAAVLDEQSGTSTSTAAARGGTSPAPMSWGEPRSDGDKIAGYTDSGGASRFFYCAKASRKEREAGLDAIEPAPGGSNAKGYTDDVEAGQDRNRPVRNNHPTVKPLAVMRWLVRLIIPPGGRLLDPFCGSGSTLAAAELEGMTGLGFDLDERHVRIANARIAHWRATKQPGLWG